MGGISGDGFTCEWAIFQVTAYSHKDENNDWVVKPFDRDPAPAEPPEPVKDGDVIRLEHVA